VPGEEADVQVQEIMTRQVSTVGPDMSAKSAGRVMAARGFAALPVVDGCRTVIGIIAEADVLRDRLPEDPRLHLRRADAHPSIPPLLVRGVMTTDVRTVLATADVAEVAHAFIDEGLRSVPVVEGERLVGIVSRRDVLRALGRPDDDIARDVRELLDSYTGRTDAWTVVVTDGVVGLTGPAVVPPVGPDTADTTDADTADDGATMRTLARTVPGVVAVRPLDAARPST